MRELCESFPNVLFMQKRAIVVRDCWRIVGTTLWSYVPPENVKEVSNCLNDYYVISIQPPGEAKRKLQVADTVSFYEQEIQFIREQIELVNIASYFRILSQPNIDAFIGKDRRPESRYSHAPCSVNKRNIAPTI